jgi:histone-lysine N-methyltransferase SETMAR
MERTDANVERIQTLVHSDQRLCVRLIAKELNMNRETVREITMENLGIRKISAKMVPRILTDDQTHRLYIASDLLHNAEMFDRVINGDEAWCFQHILEPDCKSTQWKTENSPRPKKARMSRSQFKAMLVCFFNRRGDSSL